MKVINAIRCFGAAGVLAVTSVSMTSVPASAQVGDFFCSTFSIGCPPPPPPPPPAPVVAEEPAAPVKKVHKHHVKKKVVAKKAADETQ